MEIIEPRCDNCGGTEFDISSTDPVPPPTYVPASGYFKGLGQPQINLCVKRYSHYKVVCRRCGAEYTYTP
jgi:predicted nucleic-acid-binding Zn-ribbon protein